MHVATGGRPVTLRRAGDRHARPRPDGPGSAARAEGRPGAPRRHSLGLGAGFPGGDPRAAARDARGCRRALPRRRRRDRNARAAGNGPDRDRGDPGARGGCDRPSLLPSRLVPAGDESAWATPPFEATERDGAIFGRGSADTKSNILVHVGALRAWGGRPSVGIKLLIEGQEEVGSPLETPSQLAGSPPTRC
jgi:Peptidase family M20/M25/M40